MQLLQRHATSTLLLVLASLSSFSEGFAIGPIRQGFLGSTVSDITESVNGEVYLETIMEDGFNVNQTESVVSIEKEEFISPTAPMAPPLTYRKFLTMQHKRVPVAIRYSSDAGLKPYFLTVAKKIKDMHPDVILDKLLLPSVEEDEEATFEVMVDGKVVVGKTRKERYGGGRADMSVFVSMQELDFAISRARRRRRPATVYGEEASDMRLEMLKSRRDADIRPAE